MIDTIFKVYFSSYDQQYYIFCIICYLKISSIVKNRVFPFCDKTLYAWTGTGSIYILYWFIMVEWGVKLDHFIPIFFHLPPSQSSQTNPTPSFSAGFTSPPNSKSSGRWSTRSEKTSTSGPCQGVCSGSLEGANQGQSSWKLLVSYNIFLSQNRICELGSHTFALWSNPVSVADPGGDATSACPPPPPPPILIDYVILIPFCITMLQNKAQIALESI